MKITVMVAHDTRDNTMIKRIPLFLLCLSTVFQVQAQQKVTPKLIANSANTALFVCWRGARSKSGYSRLSPAETKSFRVISTQLQVEPGQPIDKAQIGSCTVAMEAPRICIECDNNGAPHIKQHGLFPQGQESSAIKNESSHVIFVARKNDTGPLSHFSRLMPGESKNFVNGAHKQLYVELGTCLTCTNALYAAQAREHAQTITKNHVDISIDANGVPVLRQE